LAEAVDQLDRFLRPAVDQLIADNPQWRFDAEWNILPDRPVPESATTKRTLPYAAYMLFGMLSCAVVAIWRRKEDWREMKKKRGLYLFLAPSVLLLILFSYYPVGSALYHSFFVWQGDGRSTWVGLSNFRSLLGDVILQRSSINAIKMLLFSIFASTTLPLVAAELIFHLRSTRAQFIYRVLFVIPMVVPGIVTLLIWGFIFDYNLGVANQLLRLIGLGSYAQVWLGDPKIALYSLMFIGFPWIGGFALLIYYAGLQNIPRDVLDSCSIDGATGMGRIWAIDIPLVMAQIRLLVVLAFIGGVQGFQVQLLLTQGGPGYSTMVPGLHLYQNAMTYDRMGYACAIGVLLFLIVLGLTYLNVKYLRSDTEYGADDANS
jgi:ABC-type sugar transport system permease subunit